MGCYYFKNGDNKLSSTYGCDLINGVRSLGKKLLDVEPEAKEPEDEPRA